MDDKEENAGTIPSLDDAGEGMRDEQRERQKKQPGPGQPVDQPGPEGETPSPAESTPKISDEDQAKGKTAS